MKKLWINRFLSLLLSFVLIFTVLPLNAFSAIESYSADDYAANVGATARFNTETSYGLMLCDHPDNFTWVEDIANADIPGDLDLVIKDYRIVGNESNTYIFYKVEAVPGQTAPEILVENPWVYQNNLNTTEIDALIIVEPADKEVILEDTENGVTVSGNIPEGVVLDTKPVSIDTFKELTSRFDETSDYNLNTLLPEQMTMPYASMDIKLMDGDNEWQPSDGATVTVSLDAAKYGLADGDDFVVFHLHEEADGVLDAEWIGPYKVENGKAIFEMSRFSYVLILNSTLKIENVGSFYPVKNYAENQTFPVSTNGNWCIVGIYYDENDVGHVLLGQISNNIGLDKVSSVTVNGIVVPNENNNIKKHAGTITSIILQDGSINEEVISFKNVAKKQVNAIWDITCKDIDIFERIKISLESGSNGFDIGEIEVDLYLEYNIIKSVAAGTSADVTFGNSITVERGDWVIYKIELNNTGTSPLEGMLVQDILPDSVFDMNTVQMSIDGEDGAIGNWESFNPIMFGDYSSDGEFSRLLYIKAQVRSDLDITQDTAYTNKVTIDGMGMPTKESSADIIVKAPVPGVLTVSKTVTTANPNDPAPTDAVFTFTIDVAGTSQTTFDYILDGNTYTVADGGTFQLKDGQSAVFEKFPAGAAYTITETENSQYTTKINGDEVSNRADGYFYRATMVENGSPVVAFENQFKVRKGAITVNKVVDRENDYNILPDDEFVFTVTFDESNTSESYTYEIDGVVAGTIANGGTITIKGGHSFTILGYPNNTSYTITESENDKYVTAVDGQTTNVVNGISSVTGTSHTFTNTYKQVFTSLTIEKQGYNVVDEKQTFLFQVTGENVDLTVTVHGNGSATINGLKVGGEYTVTELTDWSWRYADTPDWTFITDGDTDASGTDTAAATITLGNTGNNITFTNTRDESKWLDGDTYEDNRFHQP